MQDDSSPRSNEYEPMMWESDLVNCDQAALIEMHLSYKKAIAKYKIKYKAMKKKLEDDVKSES